jgi:hypothetical protein
MFNLLYWRDFEWISFWCSALKVDEWNWFRCNASPSLHGIKTKLHGFFKNISSLIFFNSGYALWSVRFRIWLLEPMNIFLDILVGFRERGISPSQRLYLHRTAQQRKTRIYIHASGGIRTYGERSKVARVLDRAATGTGWSKIYIWNIFLSSE